MQKTLQPTFLLQNSTGHTICSFKKEVLKRLQNSAICEKAAANYIVEALYKKEISQQKHIHTWPYK